MRIFRSKHDHEEYLRLLSEHGNRVGISFLAYCLMPNHVHLIVVPIARDSLARGIGQAHRFYARAVNFRQKLKGHLFQERFYSCPLDTRHFIAAVRYIERNPVRAMLTQHAWDYSWSSAAYRVGMREADPLIKEIDPFDLDVDWKELLQNDPDEVSVLREKARTGRPCGSAEFTEEAERLTQRCLKPKPPGRPRKQK